MSAFDKSLAKGKLAESEIAAWLRRHGWTVIPVYEIEAGQGKGPQIFTPDDQIVAPDLLAWKERRFRFIEAKNKSVFSWYRTTKTWQTGIDLRHYHHYLKVGEHFGLEIWLMFLHEKSQPDPKDRVHASCPSECPTGLFGNSLKQLRELEDHRDTRWGKSGMVYWNKQDLRLISSLSDLRKQESESFDFERAPIVGTQIRFTEKEAGGAA